MFKLEIKLNLFIENCILILYVKDNDLYILNLVLFVWDVGGVFY